MDPYKFRLVLSGPCAYVPNQIAGSPTVATSWSAIMPQLKIGRSVNNISLAPHFTVLQYSAELFEADFEPTLLFRRPGGTEFAVVVLAGERIRIVSTEKPVFKPKMGSLSNSELAAGGKPTNSTFLDWLPAMERLLPGSGAFGRKNIDFFDTSGLAEGGDIAAHVLLDRGDLVTDSLVPKEFAPPEQSPGIWGFRVNPKDPDIARQSVSYSVALEMDGLTNPVKIVIEGADGTRTLKLKEGVAMPASVEIEVKNREFDEIVRLAEGEISKGDVDHDFAVLYFLSQTETQPCPVPVLVKEGGVGTRRATCGGALFAGFMPGSEKIVTVFGNI